MAQFPCLKFQLDKFQNSNKSQAINFKISKLIVTASETLDTGILDLVIICFLNFEVEIYSLASSNLEATSFQLIMSKIAVTNSERRF